MTPVCSPGGGLHFSSPSGIHHQQSAKTGRNLGGSLTSRSSWNEEACAHTGQEQVAACGLDSEAQEKAAHLSPGGTLVGWGEANPYHGSRELPEERPWAGTGCLGCRWSAAGGWGRGWRGKKAFLELGSRKKTQAGRCPSNQVLGLLSILCKAGSPPGCSKTSSLSSKGVGWDGATSQGSLSCSHISLGPVLAIQPFILQLCIVWPPGSGWTERGRESRRLGPSQLPRWY